MSYTSILYFSIFLPVVVLLCFIFPLKIRRFVILISSYIFFWLISDRLIVYILLTTLWTYISGLVIGHLNKKRKILTKGLSKEEKAPIQKKYKLLARLSMIVGIGVPLFVLLFLKYFNFFGRIINMIAGREMFTPMALLVPIGISFYTLQAISYIVDVYWEKSEGEKNLLKIAMFLCFFPQIMEGPISLYSDTSEAIYNADRPNADSLIEGTMRILWGCMKKLLIADRLNVVVKTLFDNHTQYSGVMIAVAAVAYTIQLYTEFSGVMDIVIGSARLINIKLPENFRQPFASRGASEFWRRWHITLGVWFRTYIFYPVSVSKLSKKWTKFGKKKKLSKYVINLVVTALALFPVWFCNGLWHGPKFTYLFYGMYYFVIILASTALEPVGKAITGKLPKGNDTLWWVVIHHIKTLIIIFVGELIFRADSLPVAFSMLKSGFRGFSLMPLFDGTLLTLGLDGYDLLIILLALVVVGIVGIMKERGVNVIGTVRARRLPVRWIIYYALFFAVIIFGAYGNTYNPVDLIYAGF